MGVDSETALGRCSNARAVMDLKMNSLALELLGLRLTMKLPRPKLRKESEEDAAEYKISIVRHNRSEARPRARELPNNTKRAGILRTNSSPWSSWRTLRIGLESSLTPLPIGD